MTLKEMKPGQSGQVLSIGESGPLKRRIMDMGITPGVALKVIKTFYHKGVLCFVKGFFSN